MKDLFVEKRIDPMLITENVPFFEDSAWIYELKWDGEHGSHIWIPGREPLCGINGR